MDTLEDTRGIPSHGLFQHEQKARWTCVCWSYRRRLNWIFSYKSNDVATEAGVPVSVNSNWTSVPKLPQPKCLAAKGLKTFSLGWQCRLAIGHIQVPATGQPAGKTERNYPSQLQFNNSIKPLARYQVSLATPPKWIADQREREREWRKNTGPEQGAGPGDTLEYCGPAHSTNTRNQPGLRAFQLAKPRPLLCQSAPSELCCLLFNHRPHFSTILLHAHGPAAKILESQHRSLVLSTDSRTSHSSYCNL